MAIVTYIPPFDTFRGVVRGTGGLSGQVTYPVGGANYSRSFVEPANPESAAQVAIRALMTAAAQGFSALSTANADLWRAAAVGVTRKNAAGQEYELSGANLYALINLYRTMDAQALTPTPPALTAPGAITSITSIVSDATDVEVVFEHTLDQPNDFVLIRITDPLSGAARNARPNEYRIQTATFAASIVPSAASPQTVTLAGAGVLIVSTSYVGVEILPIGPTYFPGVVRRDPSMLVGVL